MDMSSSVVDVDTSENTTYPPLPEAGSPEDSQLAQQNYTDRERVSRSWRARLIPNRRTGLTLLEKRSSFLSSDSESSRSSISLDSKHARPDGPSGEPEAAAPSAFEEISPLQHSESYGPSRHAGPSQETGRISLTETDKEDPSKNEHLYRWAMVYENQRGISLFSAPRYSSQSLLPRDPPPFSVVVPGISTINGKPVHKSHQPNISLEDFPLPDGNWRWASKEWIIDMRDDTVQHDGFEYNWFFRTKNWRQKAGHLNAGAWVRRRRWIRLMERPPLSALQPDDASKQREAPISSLSLNDIWRGDDSDWSRLHRVMHDLGRDGRKLEAWNGWLTALEANGTEGSNHSISEHMSKVLKVHLDEFMGLFIYPSSRVEFLELVNTKGLLSESEVLGVSESSPCLVDRSQLEAKFVHNA